MGPATLEACADSRQQTASAQQLQQNSNAARPAETGGVASEIVSAQLEY